MSSAGRVHIQEVAWSQYITLEPGDVTRYHFLLAQSEDQISRGEITLALVGGLSFNAAFTYAVAPLLGRWKEIKSLPLIDGISGPLVEHLGEFLGEYNNPWTARAIIEAVGRVMEKKYVDSE